jgi:PilZ domain-containing protein
LALYSGFMNFELPADLSNLGLYAMQGRADKSMAGPREDERFPYYTEIMIQSASGTRGARISDVSQGGCYIDTITPAREGEDISFDIMRPSGETVRFTGTVAYVMENLGFGIKFTDLTDEQRTAIDQIITASGG